MLQEHSFGYWLRRRRKALDLTREGLADLVGCSAATIRKIEAEERRPSAQIAARLAEIFHIPPDDRAAFLRFARGDLGSTPSESVEDAPWHAPTVSPRSNLPATVTTLIGREKEIADIREYLQRADIRLVTLIGPPGIGKTRLSIEAARDSLFEFPDGVFFIALAPLDDPSLIASAIFQALGFVETKNLPANRQLIDGIRDKRLLLVMDNCEHLIEQVASLASDLLSACSRLTILVTSREALRIPGEWLYSVPALGIPEEDSPIDVENARQFPALTLFAERARAVRSDFALNIENVRAVASICTQLDGLPLAIELIAARMRLMSPQAMLERLSDQFVLSADGMRAVPARQKTLNNAIGWSFNLLSPQEQSVFAFLSVFRGGFTLEAAESIFSKSFTEKPIADHIASLIDKSLLQRRLDSHGESRFHMLVTIKQFALSCLRQMGDEKDARDRHLTYFLDFAEEGAQEMRGPAQVRWVDRIQREHDNIRTALEWAVSNQMTEAALRLLCALGWPWEVRGHYREARYWLDRIRTLPEISKYPVTYARLLNHIGRHSWSQGNILDARALLEESQAIALKLGAEGECNLAETLNWLGLVELFGNKDSSDSAKSMFERGRKLYSKLKDQRGVALSTFHLGIVESALNNNEVALSLLEKSMSMFHQFGDLFYIARVSDFLGNIFLNQGNYEKAHLLYEQRIRIDKEVRFWSGIVEGLLDLGNLYRHQGDYDRAAQCYEESVAIGSEHSLNKYDSFYMSGLLALYLNNFALAFERLAYLLDQARKSGDTTNVSVLLTGLAIVAGGTNHPKRAAKLYGAAQAIFETAELKLSPFDQAEIDRRIQMTREQLGDAVFKSLHSKGRAMTAEQAIVYALEKS